MATSSSQPIVKPLLRTLPDLTPRERQVLQELAVVHVATASQISRLVFAEQSSATAARLAHRHLQRLQRFGLTRRLANRARDRKGGPPGYLHVLTEQGMSLSGASFTMGLRQRRSWRPADHFVDHRLAITELYVRLREQAYVGGAQLRLYQAEPDCWRRHHGPAGEQLTLKPDALLRLVVGDLELSWFVEIDLATESPRRIAAKCMAYRTYEWSGSEQQRYGVFPGVLFVVPDEARARSIQHVFDQQPTDAQELFMVATSAEALTALNRLPDG